MGAETSWATARHAARLAVRLLNPVWADRPQTISALSIPRRTYDSVVRRPAGDIAMIPRPLRSLGRSPSTNARRVRRIAFAALTCLTALMGARLAQPQNLITSFNAPNGPVRAITLSGNTLYVGGAFNLVGPVTGSGVPLDTLTATPTAPYPKVTGVVRA